MTKPYQKPLIIEAWQVPKPFLMWLSSFQRAKGIILTIFHSSSMSFL